MYFNSHQLKKIRRLDFIFFGIPPTRSFAQNDPLSPY